MDIQYKFQMCTPFLRNIQLRSKTSNSSWKKLEKKNINWIFLGLETFNEFLRAQLLVLNISNLKKSHFFGLLSKCNVIINQNTSKQTRKKRFLMFLLNIFLLLSIFLLNFESFEFEQVLPAHIVGLFRIQQM